MGREFYRPADVPEALALLRRFGDRILIVNGGTDAVLHTLEKRRDPEAFLYVAGLPGFHDIRRQNGKIVLGGGVTFNEMMESPLLADIKGLQEALLHLASPAIRAVATPAGNICTAAPAADGAAMLYALGTTLRFASAEGERELPMEGFYEGTYRTARKPDELLTAIEFDEPAPGEGTGYCRLSRRKAQDIGKVLIGTRIRLEDGRITKARIALGALNACIVHAAETESAVLGMTPEEAVAYADTHYPAEAKLRASYYTEYKKDVVCPALSRALAMALEEGGARQ